MAIKQKILQFRNKWHSDLGPLMDDALRRKQFTALETIQRYCMNEALVRQGLDITTSDYYIIHR